MPVTSITPDPDALTLVVVADYPVPVERLWQAWADPRQLERFWGPPQWPATFLAHDLRPGGRCDYAMTGPLGESARGCWEVEAVDPGRSFSVLDAFVGDDGQIADAMPRTRMEVRFEATEAGSRFVSTSTFPSLEAMEQLVAMGMVEGLSAALAQLDEVVDALREASRDLGAALEILDDTHVRVVREVRGSLLQVWRAHHEAALMQRWLLGPDGWTMPVCEVATAVGERYRYEWASDDGEQRFGFVGELLESEPPRRAVTTEQMIGMEGPGTVNELLLEPRAGGRTRITTTITYPSKEVRDMVIGTGMVDGMEASYARLEGVLDA